MELRNVASSYRGTFAEPQTTRRSDQGFQIRETADVLLSSFQPSLRGHQKSKGMLADDSVAYFSFRFVGEYSLGEAWLLILDHSYGQPGWRAVSVDGRPALDADCEEFRTARSCKFYSILSASAE